MEPSRSVVILGQGYLGLVPAVTRHAQGPGQIAARWRTGNPAPAGQTLKPLRCRFDARQPGKGTAPDPVGRPVGLASRVRVLAGGATDCFKEFKIGGTRHQRYSQNAMDRITTFLKEKTPDQV